MGTFDNTELVLDAFQAVAQAMNDTSLKGAFKTDTLDEPEYKAYQNGIADTMRNVCAAMNAFEKKVGIRNDA